MIRTALGWGFGQHRARHHPVAGARHAIRPWPVAARRIEGGESGLQDPPLVLVEKVEAYAQRLEKPERPSQTCERVVQARCLHCSLG